MDVVSLTLSVAAVVETAVLVVDYLHDCKDGGKDRIRLATEVSALLVVLENVQTQLNKLSAKGNHPPDTYLAALGGENGPVNHCKTILVQLCQKLQPKSGLRAIAQTLKWSMDKDECARYLDSIHRLQTAISLAYAQTILSVLGNVASDTALTRNILTDQEDKAIISWISDVDFDAQQKQAYDEWCPGTVTANLETPFFKSWQQGKNPYLWCPGAPGAGKTILSSVVIAHLQTWNHVSVESSTQGDTDVDPSKNSQKPASAVMAGRSLSRASTLPHTISASASVDEPDHKLEATTTNQSSPKTRNAVLGVYFSSRLSHVEGRSVFEIIFASLLKQTCAQGLGPDQELREAHRKSNAKLSKMSVEAAISHLDRLLLLANRTYIVLDGIDELTPHRDRQTFFSHLRTLTCQFSVMLVARPSTEMDTLCAPLHHRCDVCGDGVSPELYHCAQHEDGGFDICPKCYLQGSINCPNPAHDPPKLMASSITLYFQVTDQDLSTYARHRLRRHDHLSRLLEDHVALQEELIAKIVDEARSRFLVAKLILDHLEGIDRVKDMRSAMAKPFGSLNQQYRIALAALEAERPDRVGFAKEAIKWIRHAQFPMTPKQLEQAVAYSIDGDDTFDAEDVVPTSKLLEFCHGFLVQNLSDQIEFSHFTAEEFLNELLSGWYQHPRSEISATCLKYLQRAEFITAGSLEQSFIYRQESFYAWAAKGWQLHLQAAGLEDDYRLAVEFLMNKAAVKATSSAALNGQIIAEAATWAEYYDGATAMHLAASLRLPDLVLQMLKSNQYDNLDFRDGAEETVLLICAGKGLYTTIELLLNAGASVDLATSSGITPLIMAIKNKHHMVAHTLISSPTSPADINLVSQGPAPYLETSPLTLAARMGHYPTLATLLKRQDLQVNLVVDRGTALHHAAQGLSGHFECIELLVEDARCDLRCKDYVGRTAMEIAGLSGQIAIMVRLLLARDRTATLRPEAKIEVLFAVSRGPNEGLEQLLKIDGGIELEDNTGRGLLHYAASADNIEILESLLNNDTALAKIDMRDQAGVTAIEEAVQRGNLRSVAMLLMHGSQSLDTDMRQSVKQQLDESNDDWLRASLMLWQRLMSIDDGQGKGEQI